MIELEGREGVHISTVWRWALRGIRGHKLETLAIGNRRYVTKASWERWVARTNGEPVTASETPRQRERAIRPSKNSSG